MLSYTWPIDIEAKGVRANSTPRGMRINIDNIKQPPPEVVVVVAVVVFVAVPVCEDIRR